MAMVYVRDWNLKNNTSTKIFLKHQAWIIHRSLLTRHQYWLDYTSVNSKWYLEK